MESGSDEPCLFDRLFERPVASNSLFCILSHSLLLFLLLSSGYLINVFFLHLFVQNIEILVSSDLPDFMQYVIQICEAAARMEFHVRNKLRATSDCGCTLAHDLRGTPGRNCVLHLRNGPVFPSLQGCVGSIFCQQRSLPVLLTFLIIALQEMLRHNGFRRYEPFFYRSLCLLSDAFIWGMQHHVVKVLVFGSFIH